MNSLVYLTRKCPRACEYCDIRNSSLEKELTIPQWMKAFDILKEMGVQFNLILGNESWLLGHGLLQLMNHNQIPFAMYTTCPPNQFLCYRDVFFNGPIDNLSCAIDYSLDWLSKNFDPRDDMQVKSSDGWAGLLYTRKNHPDVDTQGNITMSKLNLEDVPKTVEELSANGIFVGINYIHWNKDGNYDFFPDAEHLNKFLFGTEDIPRIRAVLDKIRGLSGSLLQNIEILDFDIQDTIGMYWHCEGDPYGGPTVDADGSLRVCGYRKGHWTPKITIWDLPTQYSVWKKFVVRDAKECPGCAWSYPRMYAHWRENDPGFGRQVFIKHAGKHIDPNQWSKRKIQ